MIIELGFETVEVEYEGKTIEHEEELVLVDGQPLDPAPSQALFNHSPTGFSWGYGGKGPAQLALAILLHHTNSNKEALAFYQAFKWQFVGAWPFGQPHKVEIDIDAWLAAQREFEAQRYQMNNQ